MKLVGDEDRKEWGPRSWRAWRAYGLFLRAVGIPGGFEHQLGGHGLTYVLRKLEAAAKIPAQRMWLGPGGSSGGDGLW